MTAPTSPHRLGGDADDSADVRELADFLAGQSALDAEAALWAARRQDGLSPDEEAELQAWLAGDPARGARLGQLEGVWGQLDELPPDDVAALRTLAPSSPRDAVAGPAGHAGAARPQGRPHAPSQPGRRAWLLGWARPLINAAPQLALAGLAAMVVGGGWLGWNHWQLQPSFAQSFATARGQQLAATLPEGSTLRLDTATRLNVTLYRHKREVQMPQGQALFEVRPDAARPFHVLAGPMRITVLGTRFSVRYLPDGSEAGRVKVVVEEGRVRVGKAGEDDDLSQRVATPGVGSDTVELTAGQAVVADAQGHLAAVTRPTVATAMAWRAGRVVLNDTPLGDAVAEFERYFDTGLVIHDPKVAALRLNGSFDLRQAQAFKRALPEVLPVRLQTRADGKTEVRPVH